MFNAPTAEVREETAWKASYVYGLTLNERVPHGPLLERAIWWSAGAAGTIGSVSLIVDIEQRENHASHLAETTRSFAVCRTPLISSLSTYP